MDIKIQNGEEMYHFINKNKYLVVYPNKQSVLYKSLRDIETDILISVSTISKKLQEGQSFIFTSKHSGYTFYIEELKTK